MLLKVFSWEAWDGKTLLVEHLVEEEQWRAWDAYKKLESDEAAIADFRLELLCGTHVSAGVQEIRTELSAEGARPCPACVEVSEGRASFGVWTITERDPKYYGARGNERHGY